MALSYEEFRQALAAKGATDQCLSCGNAEWSPFGTPDEPDSVVLPTRRPNIGHEVIGIACTNCGFVHLYHFGILGLST